MSGNVELVVLSSDTQKILEMNSSRQNKSVKLLSGLVVISVFSNLSSSNFDHVNSTATEPSMVEAVPNY